ncbi:hypothetical protein AMTRI_Chr03g49890 [Amborella trichopoda]
MAMVDTGATHNFISGDEAKRLGLHLEKDSSRLKAVNSEAKPLLGVAKAVELKLGGWSGTVNLSAVPMNDFRVILGMDFLRAAKVAPMPYLGVVSIMDTKTPCMVTAAKGEKGKVGMLSAMQLTKGLKKGETTYLAALKVNEEGDGESPMPLEIEQVLKEFKDVMLNELPKQLPPRREVNHQIELEPGAKHPAFAP